MDEVSGQAATNPPISITDDGHIALVTAPAAPRERGSEQFPPPSSASMLSLLRNVEFRILTITQFLSIAGDQLARVALSVLVFNRTNSAFQAAIAYALTFVPAAIGGPLLSGFADRRPRRSVMIACDLIRVPLVGLIAIPSIPLPLAMALIAAAGLFEAPFDAARGALLPDILHGDRYTKGYAVGQISLQAAQVGGFGIAGVLLVALTPSTLLMVDAISFAVSALLLARIIVHRPAPQLPDESQEGHWWNHVVPDVRRSIDLVMRSSRVRPLVLMAWAASGFVIAFEALGAPLARASGSASWAVGILLAAQPLGTVTGALFAARIREPHREVAMRWLGVLSILPLVFGLARPSLPLLLLIGVLSGIGMSFNVLAMTLFVSRVVPSVRGRVLGFVGSGLFVTQGMGVLLAGAVAAVVDARVAVGLLGVTGTLIVLATVWDSWRHRSCEPPARTPWAS